MDDTAADLRNRALHAFWQGGIASLPVTIPLDQNALRAALLAFVAGGTAAVLSLVKGMVKERRQRQR